jgi:hypothetical protein
VGHRRNKGESKKVPGINENESTTYQNLQDTIKAVQRGKLMFMSVYIKNKERSQIKDLLQHLKFLKKQEHTKPKVSRRTEIIKIRAEINEIETKKPYKE